jgi:hypothetical protein
MRKLLKGLKSGKAPGPDGIRNDLLKMCATALAPYLSFFVKACLDLDYHPKNFKSVNTILLRKAKRDSYKSLSDYRPIALISSLAKVLKKVAAQRLTAFCRANGIIPKQHYAFGSDCPRAIRAMLSRVYAERAKSAASRRFVSLLSLDITGAFDRVDRQSLLETMARRRIPSWAILFVQSFLSHRRSAYTFPGGSYKSDSWKNNIGIPQGSPLSPILFLIFAAPMLDLFDDENKKICQGTEVVVFAFADDRTSWSCPRNSRPTIGRWSVFTTNSWAGRTGTGSPSRRGSTTSCTSSRP